MRGPSGDSRSTCELRLGGLTSWSPSRVEPEHRTRALNPCHVISDRPYRVGEPSGQPPRSDNRERMPPIAVFAISRTSMDRRQNQHGKPENKIGIPLDPYQATRRSPAVYP